MKVVLYGDVSISFHINTRVSPGFIHRATLFLIFINHLPGATSSQLGIYAADTTETPVLITSAIGQVK